MNYHNDPTVNSQGYIYTPVGFDPSRYPGPIADHPDAARWFLNCIHFRRVIRNYDESDGVNLHGDLLGEVFGRKHIVKPLREAMIEHGLIWCDHSYVVNFKSFSYGIGPKLQGCDWQRFSIKGKRFAHRIEFYRNHVREPRGFNVPVHNHLEKWARMATFDDNLDLNSLNFPNARKCKLANDQVDEIKRQYVSLTVCPYGRYHSNYSGLCRELRPFIRINDNPMVEIDIVNSQPYFLSLLLANTHLNCQNSPSFSILSNYLKSSLPPSKTQGHPTLPYECQTKGSGDFELKAELPHDLLTMLHNTSKGSFYDDFVNLGNQPREKVKKRVFTLIMGTVAMMETGQPSQSFQTLYPTAFDLMVKLKREKGYKWVGQELQRLESRAIINGVCTALMENHPEIPIITVHDSILTPPDHLSTVRGVLDAWFSDYPMSPTFKVKQ